MMIQGRRLYAIHPLLYAAFPVLFLFAQNAREMPHGDVYLPLAVVLAAAIVLTAVFSVILRNLYKGALVTTVGLLLFFSYGHVVSLVPSFMISFGDSQVGRTAIVMPAWGLILLGTLRLMARTRWDLAILTRILCTIGLILVTVQIVQGGYAVISRPPGPRSREITFSLGEIPQHRPDVYYIIMDAYTRGDVLAELYKYDNSPFLESLRDRGFFVADSSYANYSVTTHSLASSLNMNYIPEIGDFDVESDDYVLLSERLRHNDVFDLFRQLGYSIVTFSSGYAHTEMKDVDLYITKSRMGGEFANILLAGTPIAAFPSEFNNPYHRHRKHILNTFDKIPDVHEVDSPKLVFAHLVSPHPPFVFGPDGEPVQPDWNFNLNDGKHLERAGGTHEQYISGYRDQLAYINTCLLSMIDKLLSGDAHADPIIILQADHGPRSNLIGKPLTRSMGFKERYGILNAYYLPDADGSALYPRITPVNSFRVIFDECFGTDFRLLPDRIYTQSGARPFDFTDVTKRQEEP